ncbi:MAG: protein kinase [Deltaproteobacteria bacterium]|nr:protein kinase [Deltaproteobacteria bacterium]
MNQNAAALPFIETYTDSQTSPQTDQHTDLNDKIGRYVISRELGCGSTGKVYLAHDPFIDRWVAIKIALNASSSINSMEEIHQRFFNEARAAGRLMHPHIVTLYDALLDNNNFYLVMEYVEGTTLKAHCRNETVLPIEKSVDIIFQCAKAIDYAHNAGIIHRDIKPSNILLATNGDAKISDFSIAVLEGFSESDHSGSFSGSIFYSSPELLHDEILTPQSDIFSLGVVMYEMLAGVRPFRGDTEVSIFYQILNKDPEPLRKYSQDIPEGLEYIVSKALQKDPDRRYKNGLEFASDLSECYDNLRYTGETVNFQEKRNALNKLNFFKYFTSKELNEVLKATQWLEYDTESTIITEGEIDDCFYIIVLGEVAVSKGENFLSSLNQGDCFGEMAYLGKTKRTANIKALSRTILMKINASIMEETSIETQNRFFKVFSQTLIQRLERANRLISKVTQ